MRPSLALLSAPRFVLASLTALLGLSALPGCPGTTGTGDAGTDVPAIPEDAMRDGGGTDGGGSDGGGTDGGGADTGGVACATAQDARGMGDCDLVLGVAWTGFNCTTIGGCTCVGADCGALFDSTLECNQAYRGCPRVCGGLTAGGSPTCLPDELCDYPATSFCGGDDSPGTCVARPTDCPEPGGVPVCGCDGNDYLNECLANLAGTDIAGLGMCTTSG